MHKSGLVRNYRYDGTLHYECWYRNGKLHRTDGPAIIFYRKDGKTVFFKDWFVDDKLHRTDGPAYITYCEDGKTVRSEKWCINGNEIKVNDPVHWDEYWKELVNEWTFEHVVELSIQ